MLLLLLLQLQSWYTPIQEILGRTVARQFIKPDQVPLKILTAKLPNGIYLVNIITGESTISKKILINK
ncbi:MAG: T9SS type A sorting domain-containing protein [Bacteroidetes bacterium]|nr:T9SS type A sorting domain-containing protein [Bacteroidota bacterium]